MMVQALLPGCSTMQDATNQSEARRSKEPPPESESSRQYVAPAQGARTYSSLLVSPVYEQDPKDALGPPLGISGTVRDRRSPPMSRAKETYY